MDPDVFEGVSFKHEIINSSLNGKSVELLGN